MKHPVSLGVLLLALCVSACGRPSGAANGPPEIRLTLSPEHPAQGFVDIVGLSDHDLDAVSDAELTPEQWAALFHVSVGGDAPAMLGTHRIESNALRFTPQFPLDPGRTYVATFDSTKLPRTDASAPWRLQPIVATIRRPALDLRPTTVVTHVYPSADVVPENQLRFYIQFSGPMAFRSGLEFIRLLDAKGQEITDAFLPLDYELWSGDRTRFTVFVDPGRVKTGLLPQQEMGKSLEAGRTYTLAIDADWRDEAGLPLKEPYRRTFKVGREDTTPIDPSTWAIQAARAGTRDPLVVTFPEPLDHGLLFRALGVTTSADAPVYGSVAVDAHETQWRFTPREPWKAGDHSLVALSILEDLAGNQIGRAFEVDQFDEVDRQSEPQTFTRPFRIN